MMTFFVLGWCIFVQWFLKWSQGRHVCQHFLVFLYKKERLFIQITWPASYWKSTICNEIELAHFVNFVSTNQCTFQINNCLMVRDRLGLSNWINIKMWLHRNMKKMLIYMYPRSVYKLIRCVHMCVCKMLFQ